MNNVTSIDAKKQTKSSKSSDDAGGGIPSTNNFTSFHSYFISVTMLVGDTRMRVVETYQCSTAIMTDDCVNELLSHLEQKHSGEVCAVHTLSYLGHVIQ